MDPAVELKNKTFQELKALSGTAPAIAEVLRKRRTAMAAIDGDRQFSEEHKAKLRDDASKAASEALDAIDAAAKRNREQVAEVLKGARPQPADSSEALLSEQRLQRAWQRARTELDRGTTPEQVATRAAQDGDRDVFAAMREELPAYLRARETPDNLIETSIAALRELEAPVLTPIELKAREIGGQVEERGYFAEMSVNMARTEVGGGSHADFLAVTKTELIDLSEAA